MNLRLGCLALRRQAKTDISSQQKNNQPNAAILEQESGYFELCEKINATVSSLPDPVQQVFYLSRFDGLKYSEIAEALDISVKTVEVRMSKALTILREKLKSYL